MTQPTDLAPTPLGPDPLGPQAGQTLADGPAVPGQRLPALNPAHDDVAETNTRVNLLGAAGHTWMDPQTTAAVATAGGSRQDMLGTAATMRDALATSHSLSWFSADPVLEKAPSIALGLKRYINGTVGDWPIGNDGVRSVQSNLRAQGLGADLTVDGVWDDRWQAAMTAAEQKYQGEQFQGRKPGGFSATDAAHGFLSAIMPSHLLHNVVSFVEAIPGGVRSLLADLAAGGAEVVTLGAAHGGDIGAAIENIGRNDDERITAGQYVESTKHASRYLDHLGLVMMLVPVFGTAGAVARAAGGASFISDGFRASLALEEAARGPGVVAKTLLGGREATVLKATEGGARPAAGAGGGGRALGRVPLTPEQSAARAALTDGRAQGILPRVFDHVPVLRQIGPMLGELADADGWYYRLRSTLATPYRVPVIKAAGVAFGRGQGIGAGLEAVDYLERHSGGAGQPGSNIAQQQAGHNVLDSVIDAGKRYGPLTDVDNLAFVLHGPTRLGERVSDSFGHDTTRFLDRLGGALGLSNSILVQTEHATGRTWHKILTQDFKGVTEDAHRWLSDELYKAAAYFHAERTLRDPEAWTAALARKDELLGQRVDAGLWRSGQAITPETLATGGGALDEAEKVRMLQGLASEVYRDPALLTSTLHTMLASRDNYFAMYLGREIVHAKMSPKAWLSKGRVTHVAAGKDLTAVLAAHRDDLISPQIAGKIREATRRIGRDLDEGDAVNARAPREDIDEAGDNGWVTSPGQWGGGQAGAVKINRRRQLLDEYRVWRHAEEQRREETTGGYRAELAGYSDTRVNSDAVRMPTFKDWLKGMEDNPDALPEQPMLPEGIANDETLASGGAPAAERPAWLARELAKEEVGVVPPDIGAVGLQRVDNWTIQKSAHERALLQEKFRAAGTVDERAALRMEAVHVLATEFGQTAHEMAGLDEMPALLHKWVRLEKMLPSKVYGATDEAQAALDRIERTHGYRVVHGVDVGHMHEPMFSVLDDATFGKARTIRHRVVERLGLNMERFSDYSTAVDTRLHALSEVNRLFARDPETGERLVRQFGEPPPGVTPQVLFDMIAAKLRSGEITPPRMEAALRKVGGRTEKQARRLAARNQVTLADAKRALAEQDATAAAAARERRAGLLLRETRGKAVEQLAARDGIDRKAAAERLDAHPDAGAVQPSLDGASEAVTIPKRADVLAQLEREEQAARARELDRLVRGGHTPDSAGRHLAAEADKALTDRAATYVRENSMSLEDARKALAEQEGQGWSWRDLSRKQIMEIWTDPKNAPSYLRNGESGLPVGVLTGKQADLAYRAMLRGYTKRSGYMVGWEVVNDFLRGGLIRMAGNSLASDKGLVTHALSLPDSIVRVRDRVRFRMSPRYAIGELLEANWRMAQEGIPTTLHPGAALMRMGDGGRVHKEAFALLDEIRPADVHAFSDDTLRQLYQQDVYGIWNLREGEAYAAWHLAGMGYSNEQIEQKIGKIFHYGTQTKEGRTAMERSANTLFFPWSYQKVFMRNTVGYLLDHPGQTMLLSAGLAQYQQALETPGIHDWVKEHLPLLTELLKLNPLAMGISPGEVGGINRPVLNMAAATTKALAPEHALPLLNLFIPQQWGADASSSSATLRMVPLVRDLSQFLSSAKQQGQIGMTGLSNFLADDAHSDLFRNVRPAAMTNNTQFPAALALRQKLADALGNVLKHNASAGPGEKVLWPPDFDESIAGQPIDSTSIAQLVHAHYPAFSPAGGAAAAAQREAKVAQWMLDQPVDKREDYRTFTRIAERFKDSFDNVRVSRDEIGAMQQAVRDAAIHLAHTDPAFLRYYTAVTHYDNIFGPITRTY